MKLVINGSRSANGKHAANEVIIIHKFKVIGLVVSSFRIGVIRVVLMVIGFVGRINHLFFPPILSCLLQICLEETQIIGFKIFNSLIFCAVA